MGVIYFLFVCSNFFLLLASSQILGNQSFTSINHRFEIYRSVIRKLQTFLRCPSVQLEESIPPLSDGITNMMCESLQKEYVKIQDMYMLQGQRTYHSQKIYVGKSCDGVIKQKCKTARHFCHNILSSDLLYSLKVFHL